VNRLYNTAQLALFSCAFIGSAISQFEMAIRNFEQNDYYVVITSNSEGAALGKTADTLRDTVENDQRLRERKTQITMDINQNSKPLLDLMISGGKSCDVSDADRASIYAPFEFSFQQIHSVPAIANSSVLSLGGHLNSSQATTVADFLNNEVMANPQLKGVLGTVLPGQSAFISRTPLEQ
jgi:hypothetical protein